MPNSTQPLPAGEDVLVIALVGFFHGTSHVFHLLVPPLFPWLMRDFGLDFTGVGLTMTVFFAVSGVGQALAGFFVDRFGPVRVLLFGMSCFFAAGLALATASDFAALLLASALAGLGNSVLHPADFTILNRRVSVPRLGHAFAVHGLCGNIGLSLSPILLTALAAWQGWRCAAFVGGCLALPALVLLLVYRRRLDERPPLAAQRAGEANPLAFLSSSPVWLCFCFFFLITMAVGAIQNFMPSILAGLYGMPVLAAAASLSGYMLAASAGIVVGGFVARRAAHERQIAAALGTAALLSLLMAATLLPGAAIPALLAGVGFFTGIAGPSRDLLVRKAALSRFGKGAYGRVYGFVYSGLDLGMALTPLLLGGLMDRAWFASVLVAIALFQVLAVISAWVVGRDDRLKQGSSPP